MFMCHVCSTDVNMMIDGVMTCDILPLNRRYLPIANCQAPINM